MTDTIQDSFAYSRDDLQANRRGLLTASQSERVAQIIRWNRRNSLLAGVACLLSAAFLLMIVWLAGKSAPGSLLYVSATVLVFLAITAVFIVIGLRRLEDLRAGKILVAEGPASLTTRRYRGGRWTAYFATIQGVRFQLETREQFESLEAGARYRVYYLPYPPVNMILSLEVI